MKIIHQNGFTKEELLSYRAIIYKNILDSAQALVLQMHKLNKEAQNPVRFPDSLFHVQ
jgi:guanine nucleotide-binding protein G(i) subunit alpha